MNPDAVPLEVADPLGNARVIGDYDLYLFGEGNHTRIYEKLGAHTIRLGSTEGVHFAVWAPNAARVSVVGDFNGWNGEAHRMRSLGSSGVWEAFTPAARVGHCYKYEIVTRRGEVLLKTDPYGFAFEVPPRSASVVASLDYDWQDHEWMRERAAKEGWFHRPMAVYEIHLGSWMRVPEDGDRYLTYSELAERLIPYVL